MWTVKINGTTHKFNFRKNALAFIEDMQPASYALLKG